MAAELLGETSLVGHKFGDAPPLGQPLGGVLGVDPKLVTAAPPLRRLRGRDRSTDPGPCSVSQAARSPAMVVDLPVPAGPTSTSRTRPEVAIFSTATAWSRLNP